MFLMGLITQNAIDGMALQGTADIVMESGLEPLTVDKAMGTVRSILCRGAQSCPNVYAVVVRAKSSAVKKSHVFLTMESVIEATKKSVHALSGLSISKPKNASIDSIQVSEQPGVRIYRGCASLEDVQKAMAPASGIYVFPSHLDQGTLKSWGLRLPAHFRHSPIVVQVVDGVKPKPVIRIEEGMIDAESAEEVLGKDTLAWRQQFVSQTVCWTADQVASESTSVAKNRSAIASRWQKEKKIFSIRFEGKTLYPKFQFQDGSPVKAVSDVLEVLPEYMTGWDVAFFFTSPNSSLGGRKPLELLRTDTKRLISLAQAFANAADVF
jgi:hypothetical protein